MGISPELAKWAYDLCHHKPEHSEICEEIKCFSRGHCQEPNAKGCPVNALASVNQIKKTGEKVNAK